MDKEELLKEIENIPLFVLRDVATNKEEEWKRDKGCKAVTEQDKHKIFAVVTTKYQLMQFKDIFGPIIEKFNGNETRGDIYYHNGTGCLLLISDQYKHKIDLGEKEAKVGIRILNSVNCQTGIVIDFVVEYEKNRIVIPKKLKSFYRRHVGTNIERSVLDYETILTEVEDEWRTITTKFSERSIDDDEFNHILGELKLGKRVKEEMELYFSNKKPVNLWELFLKAISYVSDKQYVSEINKQKKMGNIVETLKGFAVAEEL